MPGAGKPNDFAGLRVGGMGDKKKHVGHFCVEWNRISSTGRWDSGYMWQDWQNRQGVWFGAPCQGIAPQRTAVPPGNCRSSR